MVDTWVYMYYTLDSFIFKNNKYMKIKQTKGVAFLHTLSLEMQVFHSIDLTCATTIGDMLMKVYITIDHINCIKNL